MKQFRALNFEVFRRGKGGMNFCLGRGCLVKDISIRFAVYLVNMGAEGSFGNGGLQDVCVWGGYLLLGRASVRISRAFFIVKSITINGKFINRRKKKESVSVENFFHYSFFSPSNSSSLSLSLFPSTGRIFQEMPWYACPRRASPPRRLSPSHPPPTRAGPP